MTKKIKRDFIFFVIMIMLSVATGFLYEYDMDKAARVTLAFMPIASILYPTWFPTKGVDDE